MRIKRARRPVLRWEHDNAHWYVPRSWGLCWIVIYESEALESILSHEAPTAARTLRLLHS
jgi:hypothetical protein